MRFLVAGSRDWTDGVAVGEALWGYINSSLPPAPVIPLWFGARGARCLVLLAARPRWTCWCVDG